MAKHSSALLKEIESLNQPLNHPGPTRPRAASLTLPRPDGNILGAVDGPRLVDGNARADRHSRSSRRILISPFRARQNHRTDGDGEEAAASNPPEPADGKKGIWSWKPMRALSHLMKQRLGCLFSVEVVAVHGLPASMNGLRLAVVVRKKETREGAAQTMPARVLQGSADFDETLFIRCSLYCSRDSQKPLKFEARQFLVSVVAVDAPELEFGKSTADLSMLVLEAVEKSFEGQRLLQRETTFKLYGKATGGELVLRLGFQFMEDRGLGIYKHRDSSSAARTQAKSSFSIVSPKVARSESDLICSKVVQRRKLKEIDELNLDEHGLNSLSPPSIQKSEDESMAEDFDLLEFEVIDKGVETASGEASKRADRHRAHLDVLTEFDSIAQQIRALESIMNESETDLSEASQGHQIQQLDADEEMVTREFLRMIESKQEPLTPRARRAFLPELGKGLGSVIQTRDGGFLTSVNSFEIEAPRGEVLKLAMQISKLFILRDQTLSSGFEVFRRLATIRSDEPSSKLFSWAGMDELMGKTAEQIAFEGIASAIIGGRKNEGASSSATRSVQTMRSMSAAMTDSRKERMLTGIWNVGKDPETVEEMLLLSVQKIEAMAVDTLKIQADMTEEEEEAPFVMPPAAEDDDLEHLFDSIMSLEDWAKIGSTERKITALVAVILRDPVRRFESVGAPMIAVVQATSTHSGEDEEHKKKMKVTNLHLGGLKLRSGERQRLTSVQWLVGHGQAKSPRRSKPPTAKGGGHDSIWSMSARVVAGVWMKTVRNPDVRLLSYTG